MTKAQILALYAQTRDGNCTAAQREQAHKLLIAEVNKQKQLRLSERQPTTSP